MIQVADYSPFSVQFNSQLYSGAKQNYEYQGHESQPDHGLRRIMMGARCLNPTTGRMDGVDNFASAAPAWSSYRFAFNNPNMYTDPDGNFEQSQFTSSSNIEVNGGTFNNGFREVSFRAAGYSVGYFDFSGQASGEYRRRASDVETGRIFNYQGDPNHVKVLYDDYWESVAGTGMDGQTLSGIKSIMFQPIGSNLSTSVVRPQALSASMIATTLDYYNIKNALYAKIAYDTYDIGKLSPAVGSAGKVLSGVGVFATGVDYGSYLVNGGDIMSPQTILFAGDVTVNRVGLTSAPGFFLTVGWEAGKALGRYKNYLEKKYSPGGLDGLISTPE